MNDLNLAQTLELALKLEPWIKQVKTDAKTRLIAGKHIDGFELLTKRGPSTVRNANAWLNELLLAVSRMNDADTERKNKIDALVKCGVIKPGAITKVVQYVNDCADADGADMLAISPIKTKRGPDVHSIARNQSTDYSDMETIPDLSAIMASLTPAGD